MITASKLRLLAKINKMVFAETFKSVNGVPTKVITYGKGLGHQDLANVKYLVLVIPGNPGVIDFYKDFMDRLYEQLNGKNPAISIPVWGLSHAGHQEDDLDPSSFPDLDENISLYNLDGQYNHKVRFIEEHVPKHVKVIGIGHSVGCKTWLEVIRRTQTMEVDKCAQVMKCFMLFPTIEKMRITPNGVGFTRLLRFQSLVETLVWPATLLPTAVKKFLLKIYFLGRSTPDCIFDSALKLFNHRVIRRTLTMGRFEMEEIYDLDEKTVEQNLDKLFFYFGTTDQWCPLEYAEGMKQKYPQMSFKICDQGYEHAYVIKNSSGMADIVAELVQIPN